MTKLGHTHPVLFVKLDGIGDYLFFRLFWPQIAEIARHKQWKISFLCSSSFLPIVEEYDKQYVKNFFTLPDVEKWNKSKFLFFLPQYYGRYLRGKEGHLLWKKKWGIAYNMQPAREVFVENVMTRVHSLQKISDQETNTLLAPASSYQDRVYTRLLTVSHKQFILFYFKELLEKMLEHPFKLPQLSLPFSKQSMQTLIRKNKIGPRYLVFVPFTSTSLRNWPLERFVFLANKLAAQTALKIVVIGTCKRNVRRTWADFPNIIDLVNKTSLLEAMQIAAGATYAVCSDTSLMHCALIGGAHTICLSCGRAKDLFVNYPVESGVKQQVFFPSVHDTQGIGYIEDIAVEPVWQYIQEHWLKG